LDATPLGIAPTRMIPGRDLALEAEQPRQRSTRRRHDDEMQGDADDDRTGEGKDAHEVRDAQLGPHPEHDDLNERDDQRAQL
jgi:hypothetical protein